MQSNFSAPYTTYTHTHTVKRGCGEMMQQQHNNYGWPNVKLQTTLNNIHPKWHWEAAPAPAKKTEGIRRPVVVFISKRCKLVFRFDISPLSFEYLFKLFYLVPLTMARLVPLVVSILFRFATHDAHPQLLLSVRLIFTSSTLWCTSISRFIYTLVLCAPRALCSPPVVSVR